MRSAQERPSTKASEPCSRLIGRGDRDWLPALRHALGIPVTHPTAELDRGLREFLLAATRRGLDLELLAGTYRGGELCGAVLAVQSPGRLALIVAPWDNGRRGYVEDLALSTGALLPSIFSRNVQLVEVLTPPSPDAIGDALSSQGFHLLTRLIYLRRDREPTKRPAPPAAPEDPNLNWVPFSPESADVFRTAIASTYSQTLDCPELNGLRSPDDALAGHRAAAEFDPSMWLVAMRRENAVGVLLLGGLPEQDALEIVYMGVAQPARGQGVGNSLVGRALRVAEERSAKHLALAVDRRNHPARRVYERWGFVETGTRDAWVAIGASSGAIEQR